MVFINHVLKKFNSSPIRLLGIDFSQDGLCVVNIVCQVRVFRFGVVISGQMILNEKLKLLKVIDYIIYLINHFQ